jgi:hypothetical protein
MAIKRKPTPFNVIVHGFNCKGVKAHDIMPYLMNCYKETKKSKRAWKKIPVTFDEFKQFVTDESRYMYWARCEWECLIGHWPFGSMDMIGKLHNYISTNPDVEDWRNKIDICNIITSDMEKIDVYWQIMNNIDVVTKLLMENVGITPTK